MRKEQVERDWWPVQWTMKPNFYPKSQCALATFPSTILNPLAGVLHSLCRPGTPDLEPGFIRLMALHHWRAIFGMAHVSSPFQHLQDSSLQSCPAFHMIASSNLIAAQAHTILSRKCWFTTRGHDRPPYPFSCFTAFSHPLILAWWTLRWESRLSTSRSAAMPEGHQAGNRAARGWGGMAAPSDRCLERSPRRVYIGKNSYARWISGCYYYSTLLMKGRRSSSLCAEGNGVNGLLLSGFSAPVLLRYLECKFLAWSSLFFEGVSNQIMAAFSGFGLTEAEFARLFMKQITGQPSK